eukprot:ANDGO_07323.mRNA.1 NAD/NADP-dependent betaine aldehyde dehydrogenase
MGGKMEGVVHYDLFVSGAKVRGQGPVLHVQNPGTLELAYTCSTASSADVEAAFASASAAYVSGAWSNSMSARERGRVLFRASELIREQADFLAMLDCVSTGRPIRELRAQAGRIAEWFEYFAGVLQALEGQVTPFAGQYLNYVRRVPLGVVAHFTAFNHPLLLAAKKLAPALAAGNTVVLKPSELAPASTYELAYLLKKAGLPDGVLNIVNGVGAETGAAMLRLPFAKFDITGGDAAGKLVAQAAGKFLAHCTCELGGSAPVLVFADADIDQAVNGVLFGAFIASGQTCIAAKRIMVERSIYNVFVPKLVERVKAIQLGVPTDESTQMGPVVSALQLAKIESAVNEAVNDGAQILCGGRQAAKTDALKGHYYEPTVLGNVRKEMFCMRDEIFGPVICVHPFDSEQEALDLANNTRYGLGAAVWTLNVKKAHRVAHRIKAGIVWINSHHRNDPSSPWGGFGDSGMGRENGMEALREYTQTQSIVVELSDAPFDWFAATATKTASAHGSIRYN